MKFQVPDEDVKGIFYINLNNMEWLVLNVYLFIYYCYLFIYLIIIYYCLFIRLNPPLA